MPTLVIITLYYVATASFTLPSTKAAYSCPKEWQIYDGNCYKVNRSFQFTWHQANEDCMKWKATLTDIRSSDESKFIRDLAYGGVWIGLHDLFQEGKFQWINDGTVANYTNWRHGSPNNAEENHVAITYLRYYYYRYRGTWKDEFGGSKKRFICEKLSTSTGCPSSWKLYTGKCYLFSNTKSTWQGSRDQCMAKAGDLAKVSDKHIAKFMNSNAGRHDYWIGLHRLKTPDGKSKWVWLEETTETSYVNWDVGQPNNANSDRQTCVTVWSNPYLTGRWIARSCSANYYYACEKIAPTARANCTSGWKQFRASCYSLNRTDLLPWDKARKSCQAKGGDLATISDDQEQQFLNNNFFKRWLRGGVWIGLNKADDGWNWIDNKPAKQYTYWYPDQPKMDFPEENCVVLHGTSHNNGSWDNVDCESKASFGHVCEMQTATCPSAWIAFGGHCYKYNTDKLTWGTARKHCRSIYAAADLVVIESSSEQMWIQANVKVTSWIGLNSNKKFGSFVWLDTTTKPIYTHWGYREPNLRPQESCVYYASEREGRWIDEHCNKKYGYICKKKAGGDPAYYDFKFKSSVYQIVTVKMSRMNAEAFCKERFGLNAGLAIVDTSDEHEILRNELDARLGAINYTKFGGYWIGGSYEDNTTISHYKFWDTNYPVKGYGRTCFSAYRSRHYHDYPGMRGAPPGDAAGYWTTEINLRNEACCQKYHFICEKNIGVVGAYYDFAYGGSVYRIVAKDRKEPKDANKTCQNFMSGGYLAQMDSQDELKVISRELTAHHVGKVVEYWISGNPQLPKFEITWASQLSAEHKCMYLVHTDVTKIDFAKASLDVYPSKCAGAKPFLCERRLTPGEKAVGPSAVPARPISEKITANATPAPSKRLTTVRKSGCNAPCLGLAISLPIVVVISVVLTAVLSKWYREGYCFICNKASDRERFGVEK